MNGRRSTLSDIARAVGVDVSTVSLVLNRKPRAGRLRPETRERIEQCARQLGYRPSLTARALLTGKTGMLGMVVGDIASTFYAELTAAALRIAERHGRQLLVAATEWSVDKERRALDSLLNAGVDGIIFMPGSFLEHSEQVAAIRRERIPVVTYDYKVPGASAIFCDYAPGMERAVELLSARHRQILCLLNRDDHSPKLEPLLAACRKFGCHAEIIPHGGSSFSNFEKEIDLSVFLSSAQQEACIVCGGEDAVYILNRLMSQGVSIPHKLELVGLAGNRLSHFTNPSLAVIQMDTEQLMEAAFRLIESGEESVVRVPTGFIPGGSVLPRCGKTDSRTAYDAASPLRYKNFN
ncbi:MAG: LacI family DNA-binding transcriptional regulator [Lentisphaeria bacterium]|nr:LacI family DNA-binding transcriptional regulator [Lentisphaeria bacterium]